MKLTWSAVVIVAFSAMSAVNAHFQVTFPAIRGDFNEDNETQFCGQHLISAERPRRLIDVWVVRWVHPARQQDSIPPCEWIHPLGNAPLRVVDR